MTNVDQLIRYLRLNLSIQDPEGVVEKDEAYLSMTDEDLKLYMQTVLSRNFPHTYTLEYLRQEDVYPLILLTRKELYYALATKEAPLYDLGADDSYIKRSQRFDHYMRLIAQVDKEYGDFLKDGGGAWQGHNTLSSFDVLISDRYATKRNFEKGARPAPLLYILDVTENSVEVSWSVKVSRFSSYKVFVSEEPIVDEFNTTGAISSSAKLVAEIRNVHQTKCRIEGLKPDTDYYVAVSVVEKSSLVGYAQEFFSTLPPIVVQLEG